MWYRSLLTSSHLLIANNLSPVSSIATKRSCHHIYGTFNDEWPIRTDDFIIETCLQIMYEVSLYVRICCWLNFTTETTISVLLQTKTTNLQFTLFLDSRHYDNVWITIVCLYHIVEPYLIVINTYKTTYLSFTFKLNIKLGSAIK